MFYYSVHMSREAAVLTFRVRSSLVSNRGSSMRFTRTTPVRLAALFAAVAYGGLLGVTPASAQAAGDSDGDRMPNVWERNHNLNPFKANATGDPDHDSLRNLAEYRNSVLPRSEDSDRDGHDDGDEVYDGFGSTDADDQDTNNDGELDGDEDADRDGVDNEDEDDGGETCVSDDDDRDGDHVSNEDENENGGSARDADSDDDGVADGDEDSDEDGETDEDEDDSVDDDCDGDSDDDGEADEDESDVMGTVVSFDGATGTLIIDSLAVGALTFVVTEDTEIEIEDGEDDGTTADLTLGTRVAEVEVDDDGTLEEIELYSA